ncbi:MAG TPA: extracellular solute-binding protein [Anaerolineales bacterium]|nr:extracellular solute-binding protein [Anaerolineales bacterium]
MRRSIFLVALVLLSGCSSLQDFDTDWIDQILYTPTPTAVETGTPTPSPTEPTQSSTGQPEPAVAEPRILRLWLPPQFNPNANNSSAELLKERLNNFEAAHPGLEIDVRIKAETGEADLLNSLAVTSMAAPSALPDLVALPRHGIVSASQKGLLQPLEELTRELQNPDWYPYARELGEIEGTTYGLPFAGDALVIVYRPELVWIKNWNDILLSESQLVFSGADPQAEVALSLYASAGGELTDAQGNPTLDQDILIEVLDLFSRGRGVSLFPDAAWNITNDEQVLQEYRSRRTEMAILHYSRYRVAQDGLFQPLMSLSEDPYFTFAGGWMWAMTGAVADNESLSVELAEYLTDEEFLTAWISETGYLPTRRFSEGEELDASAAAVIEASQPVPSMDTLLVLGPLMQDAVVRVLDGEQPEAVARSVIEELR